MPEARKPFTPRERIAAGPIPIPSPAAGVPLRLELDAEAQRDPVHEVEVGRDRRHAVDILVRQPGGPQPFDLREGDVDGAPREEEGVVEDRAEARRDTGPVGVRRNPVGEVALRDLTERRPVVGDSIVATVGARDGQCHSLALEARHPGPPEHKRHVQLQVRASDLGLDAVDGEDVRNLAAPPCDLGRVLRRQVVSDVAHHRILPHRVSNRIGEEREYRPARLHYTTMSAVCVAQDR